MALSWASREPASSSLRNTAFTEESLKSMLERLGVSTRGNLNTKNVAAVMVTAKLPPFARRGAGSTSR